MTLHPRAKAQRGAAALVVTALLFFAMLLVVAAANRSLLVEARSSADQYRSTQAFEAAEAGLEWMLAKLNDDTPLGEDCLASNAAGALSFRDRHLRYDMALASLAPVTWDDAGSPKALQAKCVRGDAGWSCSCPAAGLPTLPALAGTATAPTFNVGLSPGATPGLVVAVATGCTAGTTSCGATSDVAHEASARLEVTLGLLPALRTAPVAALTARGDIDAGDASLGLQNRDAEGGGVAVDAGGHVSGTALRLVAPAGSSLEASIVSGDGELAGLDGERFFKRWFGMGKTAWSHQPAVTRIACGSDCGRAVMTAVAHGSRLLSVDGDLTIDGPAVVGTAEQPVVIVASGALHLRDAVSLNGLVFARSIDWLGVSSGAAIRGAALADGNYSGDATADFIHDQLTLARLHGSRGSFVRVAGSWKDF